MGTKVETQEATRAVHTGAAGVMQPYGGGVEVGGGWIWWRKLGKISPDEPLVSR